MSHTTIRLKKGEHRRIRSGHPWVYSNEIDTAITPLKELSKGQIVAVESHDKTVLGAAYVNPNSLIAARLYSRNANQQLDQVFFVETIKNALSLREELFPAPYYRLAFSEADNLPGLVIDRFGNHFVLQINTAGMELKKDLIVNALREIFPDIESMLFRNDSQIREHEGLELYITPAYQNPPELVYLEENNVRFHAPLLKGQKTGWFYDHRLNRARLQHYVHNKRVLDVFSYAGGWGIQAAVFGADKVECIEVSATACEYITANAKLNGVEDRVSVICDDAFDALKKLLQTEKTYDVIILDPPAFVKKFKDRKEGLLAYQRLNELALKILVPGGILVTCSCSMHVNMEDLIDILQRVSYRTQTQIQVLERGHQGPDHPIHLMIPETDYLKALFVRKL